VQISRSSMANFISRLSSIDEALVQLPNIDGTERQVHTLAEGDNDKMLIYEVSLDGIVQIQ
jgi:hypothetical protein